MATVAKALANIEIASIAITLNAAASVFASADICAAAWNANMPTSSWRRPSRSADCTGHDAAR